MATARIYREEILDDAIPPVCAKCGAASTTSKSKNFSWCPPWVAVLLLGGLVPYVIVALILTRRMRVEVPLCDQHSNHWSWRTLVILGGFAVLAVVGTLAIVYVTNAPPNRGGDDHMGFLCVGGSLVGLVWLIVAAILQNTAIRPNEITEDYIVLMNVSPEFGDAVEDERDREDREYERRRRGRRDEHRGDQGNDRSDRYRARE